MSLSKEPLPKKSKRKPVVDTDEKYDKVLYEKVKRIVIYLRETCPNITEEEIDQLLISTLVYSILEDEVREMEKKMKEKETTYPRPSTTGEVIHPRRGLGTWSANNANIKAGLSSNANRRSHKDENLPLLYDYTYLFNIGLYKECCKRNTTNAANMERYYQNVNAFNRAMMRLHEMAMTRMHSERAQHSQWSNNTSAMRDLAGCQQTNPCHPDNKGKKRSKKACKNVKAMFNDHSMIRDINRQFSRHSP